MNPSHNDGDFYNVFNAALRDKHMGDMKGQLENAPAEARSGEAETIVRVEHVSRVYRVGASKIVALNNISCEVPSGRLVAFKGRSGSGKTTLLNVMGGLDKPTSGEIFLFGQAFSHFSATQLTELRRHRIGFVFQSFAIIPMLSALENVELILRIAGIWRERRQQAMRSLEIVGLAPWAHHRPWELSGGQQQRVAIARALATHPSLILADEPTGELDSAIGRQIMALFRYIVDREGITIIMATHDPAVEDYAHIVYELSDGQVREAHFSTTN
jgi:putative ABC transport system ATP-binding protein